MSSKRVKYYRSCSIDNIKEDDSKVTIHCIVQELTRAINQLLATIYHKGYSSTAVDSSWMYSDTALNRKPCILHAH